MQSYEKYLGYRPSPPAFTDFLISAAFLATFSIYMVVAVPLDILIATFKFITATLGREPAPASRVVTALRACVRAFLAAVVAIHVVVAVSRTAFFLRVFHIGLSVKNLPTL